MRRSHHFERYSSVGALSLSRPSYSCALQLRVLVREVGECEVTGTRRAHYMLFCDGGVVLVVVAER